MKGWAKRRPDGLFIAFVIIIRLVFVKLVFKVIVKGVVFGHATNTAGSRY
jgi:hypothetical protein